MYMYYSNNRLVTVKGMSESRSKYRTLPGPITEEALNYDDLRNLHDSIRRSAKSVRAPLEEEGPYIIKINGKERFTSNANTESISHIQSQLLIASSAMSFSILPMVEYFIVNSMMYDDIVREPLVRSDMEKNYVSEYFIEIDNATASNSEGDAEKYDGISLAKLEHDYKGGARYLAALHAFRITVRQIEKVHRQVVSLHDSKSVTENVIDLRVLFGTLISVVIKLIDIVDKFNVETEASRFSATDSIVNAELSTIDDFVSQMNETYKEHVTETDGNS